MSNQFLTNTVTANRTIVLLSGLCSASSVGCANSLLSRDHMHVLVTGATGFIGRHVVRRLQTEGCQVEAVSLHGGHIEDLPVQLLDLRASDAVQSWSKGKHLDAVVHLAATLPNEKISSSQAFNDNRQIDANTMRIAQEARARVIYASGSSVYDFSTPPGYALTEDTPVSPNNLYFASKLAGEQLFNQAHISLRISAPYGPGSTHTTVVNIFIDRALRNDPLKIFGSGKRAQDFTYIADVVQAIWMSLITPRSGVFNIASGKTVTMNQLARLVLQAVDRSVSTIEDSTEPDPEESNQPWLSIERARKELGWVPKIPLLTGLRLLAEYRRKTVL